MRPRAYMYSMALLSLVLALGALLFVSCGGNDSDSEDTGNGDSNGAAATEAPVGDSTGVTDTEIRIGTLLPISNSSAAAWGIALSESMQGYFDYINDQGGIYGRKLKLYVGDNQYSGAAAAEAVRKLVDQDKVFLIQGSLGTEAHTAVWKYLEERGIPDMYILTGNSKWTVPVSRNRFTSLIDYTSEGRTFAKYVAENFDGGKLGIIAQNDDYGREGEAGMRQGLEEQGADVEVIVEYYDAAQSDVTAQVQRLHSAGVDVMAFWGAPVQGAGMMKVAREMLNWDVQMMINSANALEVLAVLAGNDNIEGVISAQIGLQSWQLDEPVIAETKELMAKYAPETKFDNTSLGGWNISQAIVQTLKQAGPNLTREAFLDAAEATCEYKCGTCLVPGSTSPTDHRSVEAEILVKGTVDRSVDPPLFFWEPFGEPIDYESTTDCTLATPNPEAKGQPGVPLPGEEEE